MSSSFSDVTESVGISAVDGYLAAFGDFNGDKQTDLFVVTDGGKLTFTYCTVYISYFFCLTQRSL